MSQGPVALLKSNRMGRPSVPAGWPKAFDSEEAALAFLRAQFKANVGDHQPLYNEYWLQDLPDGAPRRV